MKESRSRNPVDSSGFQKPGLAQIRRSRASSIEGKGGWIPMVTWCLIGAFVTALLLSVVVASLIGPYRKDWFVGAALIFIAICISVLLWPIAAVVVIWGFYDLYFRKDVQEI